jgi:HNH endonuclease/AP2 domain
VITQEIIKSLFDYNPDTGEFTRKYLKKKCGHIKNGVHFCILIKGVTYRASHLAWLYMYGIKPRIIYFINGITTDVRINNLTNIEPKKIKLEINQETLKKHLHYCKETGVFTWLKKSSNQTIGKIAGYTEQRSGYIAIGICGKQYYAHRLAFLFMEGEMPKGIIDHIDMNTSNNAFSNLRHANRRQNMENIRFAAKNNTLGILGVGYDKRSNKYRARITTKGKEKHIGMFDTAEEAKEAYISAKRKMHEYNTL